MQNFHKLQTKISSLVVASLFPIVSLAQSTTETNYEGKVGINTDKPTNTLHILSEKNPLRMEGLQSSSTTNDTSLVVDANGVVYKRLNYNFVGYLRNNYQADTPYDRNSTPNINGIYTINDFEILINDGPVVNGVVQPIFNSTNGNFTAPVDGVYRVKITLSMGYYPTDGNLNYVVGLVNANTQAWVARFSAYKAEITSHPLYSNATGRWLDSVGSARTFEGVVRLTGGTNYYFGSSGGYTILANPEGQTGSGIGTLFEIELLKTN